MNNSLKEILNQLGIKQARKGTIFLDDFDRMKLKSAGISEYQMIQAYRKGEEETPNKFVLVDGKYKVNIVLKQNPNKKEMYQLVSCWLTKNWK